MKVFIRGLWFLFFLCFSTIAHAEREKQFTLNLEQNEQCRSLSIGFSVSSDHTKKGDRGGLLNQHNHGKIAECFLSENEMYLGTKLRSYMLTGALTNSQWGPTLVHGFGLRLRSPQLWRFSVEGGYEATLTYYERGCATSGPMWQLGCFRHGRQFVIAPLPMTYVGVNFELPSMGQALAPFLSRDDSIRLPNFMHTPMGELSLGRRTLGAGIMSGKEKIYLNTITWTKRF
jgi:hypothetical protein